MFTDDLVFAGKRQPFFPTDPLFLLLIKQPIILFMKTKTLTLLAWIAVLTGSLSLASAQGKITFANTPGGTAKAGFKTSEYIYAKMELPHSLKEFFGTDNSDGNNQYPKGYLVLDIKVIDEEDNELGGVYKKYLKPADAELKGTAFLFDIYPEPSKASTVVANLAPFTTGIAVPFYSVFDQSAFYGRAPVYAEGKSYKVSVSLSRWKLDDNNSYWTGLYTTCSGTFTLEYHAADVAKITSDGKQAKELVAQNSKRKETEDRGLPKEWSLKSAKNGSGETDEELKRLFLSQEARNTEVIRLVVLPAEGGWVVYTDEKAAYRKILFRWFNQTLVFFYKRDGKYYYAKGGVRQDYTGDNNYGKSYLKWEEKSEVAARYVEEALKAGK
jgi:hypothetical protein